MQTPIILLCGAAGSGKDTVASFIAKYATSALIAQADPMKRFAHDVFGFTEEQLWGPSECRNAADDRYQKPDAWTEAAAKLRHAGPGWVASVLPDLTREERSAAFIKLMGWFNDVATHYGAVPKYRYQPAGAGFEAYPEYTAVYTQGLDPQPGVLTPRYVLQTLGTEWGRQFSPNMWNDYALRIAKKLLAGGCVYTRMQGITLLTAERRMVPGSMPADPEFVVITDGRFRNEVLGVSIIGGMTVNITSPSESNAAVEAAGVKSHKSETELKGIPASWYRHKLINNKKRGLLALENVVARMVRHMKTGSTSFTTDFEQAS